MVTRCTGPLKTQLSALTIDSEKFALDFNGWKAGGEKSEFESFLFGKDGAYTTPHVDGQPYLLRHVHLVPLKDMQQLSIWQKFWQRRKRKSSNRALVYASNSSKDHLLIYILEEPTAHRIASMKTPADKQLMQQFAAIAAAFLHDGSIIA